MEKPPSLCSLLSQSRQRGSRVPASSMQRGFCINMHPTLLLGCVWIPCQGLPSLAEQAWCLDDFAPTSVLVIFLVFLGKKNGSTPKARQGWAKSKLASKETKPGLDFSGAGVSHASMRRPIEDMGRGSPCPAAHAPPCRIRLGFTLALRSPRTVTLLDCRRRRPAPLSSHSRQRSYPVCRSMSRGTRPSDDIWALTGLHPNYHMNRRDSSDSSDSDVNVDKIHYQRFVYPKSYDLGTGRVYSLRTRLMRDYNLLSRCDALVAKCRKNEKKSAYKVLYGTRWNQLQDALKLQDEALKSVIQLIAEIKAIGYKPFILEHFADRVRSQPYPPLGSMAYMEKRPHYISPEKYAIPVGLPTGDDGISNVDDIKTIGDANSFLMKRYELIVWHLNRIRFLQNHTIQTEAIPTKKLPFDSKYIPFNLGDNLSVEIKACKDELDMVLAVLQKFPDRNGLFTIPKELRTQLFKHSSFIYDGCSALFCIPRPVVPTSAYYMFFQNSSGFFLFHAKQFDNCSDPCAEENIRIANSSLHAVESFSSAVQLISFFPFPPSIKPFIPDGPNYVPPMLWSFLRCNLPNPTCYRHYQLGVKDDLIRFNLPRFTGIPCRMNKFFLIIERGIRINLDHLLM